MTRRHFVEAARYIRENLTGARRGAAVDLMVHLGLRFNPRFDVLRFLNACGDGAELARRGAARACA